MKIIHLSDLHVQGYAERLGIASVRENRVTINELVKLLNMKRPYSNISPPPNPFNMQILNKLIELTKKNPIASLAKMIVTAVGRSYIDRYQQGPNLCSAFVPINLNYTKWIADHLQKIYANESEKPLIIITGDFVDDGVQTQYKVLSKLLQESLHGFNILYCPGNHDYAMGGVIYLNGCAAGYNEFVPSDQRQFPTVKTINDCVFIGLDSMAGMNFLDFRQNFTSKGKIGSKQLDALKTAIKAHPDKKKIVYLHHNPFYEGSSDMILEDRKDFLDVIGNNDVQVLLCGHTHTFSDLVKDQKAKEKYGLNVALCSGRSTYADKNTKNFKCHEIDTDNLNSGTKEIIIPSYNPKTSNKIRLTKLVCEIPSSGTEATPADSLDIKFDDDDTYAKFYIDGREHSRWPADGHHDMNSGYEVNINSEFTFNNNLRVDLWEWDFGANPDDPMGSHTFYPSTGKGSVDIRTYSHYQLSYEYLGPKEIHFKTLKCIQPTPGGDDDTFAKFIVDGKENSRWPGGDKFHGMGSGDVANINSQIVFRNTVNVELWEHDKTSKDDRLGDHTFFPGSGAGTVDIRYPIVQPHYQLHYEYFNSKTCVLRSLKNICVEGLDEDVIKRVIPLGGQISEAAARVLGNDPFPPLNVVDSALNAGASAIMNIPFFANEINDKSNDPDDLYLSPLSTQGREYRLWPAKSNSDGYVDVYKGQIKHIDNVRLPLVNPVHVNFWEYDSGSGDDFLGAITITGNTNVGTYVNLITGRDEGAIYLLAYSIVAE